MIIGYKPQFPEKILAGIKKHTIREDIYDRWHAGMKMHQSTGVRTKQYRLIRIDTCTGTQKIEIVRVSDYLHDTIVKVDDRKLTEPEIQQLAYNDGFDNLIDFWMWFADGFKGKIIHWTELRY